jgi:hypothetical protein
VIYQLKRGRTMHRRFIVQSTKKYAIYGVGCVLLASGLNYKFASECVAGLRAMGQVVTMCEI